ncbi:NaeI family type II restriction endonuclease [Streptomyces sp. NPDC006283]|uniref:NaeI family type II restriction endonuclease n=1 Tax=Streptomyces sp. NPDC006283 TaxID=3156741 RepID=UPI0033B7E87D
MLPIDISAANMIASQRLREADPELATVYTRLEELDPDGRRFSTVLRDTIDQLLNGEATGRYDWNTLFKTEKTHAGTLVEINLQREFKFSDGISMDYRIGGIEVDCKYSQQFGGWMIPPEAVGHLCLLVWADDFKSLWSAGLVRVRREWLNQGNNRDLKLTLKSEHRNKIAWIQYQSALPENVLLHSSHKVRTAIFSHNSGQARVNELFQQIQNRRIGRNTVRTVAQQKDYMKRVRGNGGARSALQRKGLIIMGDYEAHRRIAAALHLPVPGEGEFVSTRVVLAGAETTRPGIEIDGQNWVRARDEEPDRPGPTLPAPRRG